MITATIYSYRGFLLSFTAAAAPMVLASQGNVLANEQRARFSYEAAGWVESLWPDIGGKAKICGIFRIFLFGSYWIWDIPFDTWFLLLCNRR